MSPTEETDPDGGQELDGPSQTLRAAGALGRSDTIQRLFDYLLLRSQEGQAPKEIEVAEAVFGRRAGFDISQDSTVRVYVHRLRRKLEEFYAGAGRDEVLRLAIPKGEYRLVVIEADPQVIAPLAPAPRAAGLRWLMLAAIALLVINLAAAAGFWWNANRSGYAAARRSAAWAPVLEGDRPVTLVVGDYYIFGETDEHGNVSRLIREYDVNSAEDFDRYLMDNPPLLGRYADLGLHYLPVSIASALHDITPLIAQTRAGQDRIKVIKASDLTAEMLKTNNIIYIGYISGLGILREPVFAGSRYRVGDTYDALIDQANNQIFESQEGGPEYDITKTRLDYGFVSTFKGPQGGKILVIAGNRDVGVMETAKAMADPVRLRELSQKAGKADAFEALYEVEAINRVNLHGKLLRVTPLAQAQIWSHRANLQFPRN